MPPKGDRVYVGHILEAARKALAYTAGMTLDAFLADLKTQDAVIRQLEIIGEAAKRVSRDFRARHPYIPWPAVVETGHEREGRGTCAPSFCDAVHRE